MYKRQHKALQQIQEANAQVVITQPRSPSCGCGKIYDGSFQGRLINDNGVFVQLCHQAGIKAVSYTHLDVYKRQLIKTCKICGNMFPHMKNK